MFTDYIMSIKSC